MTFVLDLRYNVHDLGISKHTCRYCRISVRADDDLIYSGRLYGRPNRISRDRTVWSDTVAGGTR